MVASFAPPSPDDDVVIDVRAQADRNDPAPTDESPATSERAERGPERPSLLLLAPIARINGRV